MNRKEFLAFEILWHYLFTSEDRWILKDSQRAHWLRSRIADAAQCAHIYLCCFFK